MKIDPGRVSIARRDGDYIASVLYFGHEVVLTPAPLATIATWSGEYLEEQVVAVERTDVMIAARALQRQVDRMSNHERLALIAETQASTDAD